MTDLLGKMIKVGDAVVYGKSSRHDPINVGIVVSIDDDGTINIKGKGNHKLSPICNKSRIVVLPDSYKFSCRTTMGG